MTINVILAITSSVVLTVLVSFPVYEYYARKRIRRKVIELKEQHRKDWEELLYKLNHSGAIPKGATSLGLIGLISLAISRCITSLEERFNQKDWNTEPVITELHMIVMADLGLLHKQLGDFLEAQRNHLKDYQHKQE